MDNSTKKLKTFPEALRSIPKTLEEFEALVKVQHPESSSAEQPEATRTFEVRFVRNPQSQDKRILIPFSLSAEEALRAVKAHLLVQDQSPKAKPKQAKLRRWFNKLRKYFIILI